MGGLEVAAACSSYGATAAGIAVAFDDAALAHISRSSTRTNFVAVGHANLVTTTDASNGSQQQSLLQPENEHCFCLLLLLYLMFRSCSG